MGQMNKLEKKRSVLLDIFRIILCIGVIVYHYTPERPSSGPLMVNGFLVMSGFLLGCYFLKADNFDVVKFYKSKILRLVPMFVVVLLLGIICAIYAGRALPDWDSAGWVRFNITSLFSHYSMPLWYMGVEFSLLLIAPVLFYLLRINKLCLFGGVMLCLSAYLYSRIPDSAPFGDGLYFSTIARCWQFVAGIIAACFLLSDKFAIMPKMIRNKSLVWILFGVFCVTSLLMMFLKQESDLKYWNYTFSFDLITIGFYVLFIPMLYQYRWDASPKIRSFITNLSDLTYPIFLCHVLMYQVCYKIMGDIFGDNCLCPCPMAVLATVVSIVFAFLLLLFQKKIQKRYWGV